MSTSSGAAKKTLTHMGHLPLAGERVARPMFCAVAGAALACGDDARDVDGGSRWLATRADARVLRPATARLRAAARGLMGGPGFNDRHASGLLDAGLARVDGPACVGGHHVSCRG